MNKIDQLIKLKKHLDEGIINDEEFRQLKSELIGIVEMPISYQKKETSEPINIREGLLDEEQNKPITKQPNQVFENNPPTQSNIKSNETHSESIKREHLEVVGKSNNAMSIILGTLILILIVGVFWVWLINNSQKKQMELAIRNKTYQDSIANFQVLISVKEASRAQKIADSIALFSNTSATKKASLAQTNGIQEEINESVKIGNQIWMTQNLNVDKFRNGDPIPEAKNENDWKKYYEEQQPSFCYLLFDSKNKRYGKIYNWYANFDLRGLAPRGWHTPKMSEWKELENYLGGEEIAGSKMVGEKWSDYFYKEHSIKRNNESGFNAIIAGLLEYNLYYRGDSSIPPDFLLDRTNWWSSEEPTSFYIKGDNLLYSVIDTKCMHSNKYSFYDIRVGQGDGCYLRCIRD